MVSFDMNVFIELFLISVNAFMFVYRLGEEAENEKKWCANYSEFNTFHYIFLWILSFFFFFFLNRIKFR